MALAHVSTNALRIRTPSPTAVKVDKGRGPMVKGDDDGDKFARCVRDALGWETYLAGDGLFGC